MSSKGGKISEIEALRIDFEKKLADKDKDIENRDKNIAALSKNIASLLSLGIDAGCLE